MWRSSPWMPCLPNSADDRCFLSVGSRPQESPFLLKPRDRASVKANRPRPPKGIHFTNSFRVSNRNRGWDQIRGTGAPACGSRVGERRPAITGWKTNYGGPALATRSGPTLRSYP
jgi:hypothetical protein